MMDLYTKNGRPLQVFADIVYSGRGLVIGRINRERVYDPHGRYVGTIVGARLVCRTEDGYSIGSPFSAPHRTGSGKGNFPGSVITGREPRIPD